MALLLNSIIGALKQADSGPSYRRSRAAVADIPAGYLRLYLDAARRYDLDWAILAAIEASRQTTAASEPQEFAPALLRRRHGTHAVPRARPSGRTASTATAMAAPRSTTPRTRYQPPHASSEPTALPPTTTERSSPTTTPTGTSATSWTPPAATAAPSTARA